MPKPTFTPQDVQNLVATARAAPLNNMAHAENVNALLAQFLAWYRSVQPKPKTVTPIPKSG